LLCRAAAADGLWQKKDGSGRDLLKADEAFRLEPAQRDGDRLTVGWIIAPGYYLYRKRLAFLVVAPSGSTLAPPVLPKGEVVHDANEGDAEVYRSVLQATLHWPAGSAAPQRLRISYQGCAEIGVCYPPQTRLIDVVDPLH